MTTLMQDMEHIAQNEHPEAFELCICSLPRWRHPSNEEQRKTVFMQVSSSQVPHHLFIPPDLGDGEQGEVGPSGFVGGGDDPFAQIIFEALRRTAHIGTRGIRAAYIARDLQLDGYAVMRREANGRFGKLEKP